MPPLSNYAPLSDYGSAGLWLLPDYDPRRTMPPAGQCPLPDYGLCPGQSKVFAV